MKNYRRSEATEQIAVIQWCEINKFMYPELKLIFHVPNGGTRNKIEAANLKRQGVKSGVPDLFLPVARHDYNGLFIEMKYGKNKTTENQKIWIEELQGQGYLCQVCNGAEEAVEVLKKYMKK